MSKTSLESLYAIVEKALDTVSDITVCHTMPLGRYYKLKDGGEFLFVDLIFFRVGDQDHHLDVERHGHPVPLFDKADWLRPKPLDAAALAARRDKRYRELQTWFLVSQGFVRKAILRGEEAEAVAAFWDYTLKPLTELLRMRYCPVRWDFGMRYLDRDLPVEAYEKIKNLTFARDLNDVKTNWRSPRPGA